MMSDFNKTQTLNKWRLILGKNSENHIAFQGNSQETGLYESMENTLDFLYNMEYGEDIMRADRKGGLESSMPQAVQWIDKVRKLFPKRTVEILEKQALDHFGLTELITDKKVLSKMKPNMDLLKTVLQYKNLMKSDVMNEARRIISTVVEELTEKIRSDIRKSLLGKLNRNMPSNVKSMRNLDFKKTIKHNLKNYDKENNRIVLKNVYFSSRTKRYNKWRVIIAVDESGSMLDSVIYSAVMAGIFAKLPMIETRLVIFDTSVVDLSGYADDPVEVLMGVQLGGGTDINNALSYCETLCNNPYETIYVVVTDLYEGSDTRYLLKTCSDIISAGSRLVILTALDRDSNPSYDVNVGQKIANMGAFVGAMTPEQLGDHIGKMIQ